MYMITRETAMEIAQDAYDNAGYSVINYVGHYMIWESEEGDVDYAVAINKEADENGNDQHYAIYVSTNGEDESWWEYTDTLDVTELANELMRIAYNIEEYEMKKRGLVEDIRR